MEKNNSKKNNLVKFFTIIILCVFFLELFIMFIVEILIKDSGYIVESFVDSILLAIFISPVLYLFSFKFLIEEKNKIQSLVNDLEKFKMVVEKSEDQVVISDKEGIVLYGNQAVKKNTGYEPEEAIGKKAAALWKTPMPLEYYQEMWDTIKNKKQTFNSEIQNRRKNGELYTSSINIYPILDENGDVIYFASIERDITERKEAEEKIRKILNDLTISKSKDDAIFESIGDGIIITNEDGLITLINDSALKMIGYTKEDVFSRPVVEILKIIDEKGDIIPENKRPVILALATGEKTSVPLGDCYYYHRKDGDVFPVGITVTPFLFNGKIIGTIEVFRDITVEKNIDKAKTEFVSLASHQLKTPLTTIGWYSEILLAEDAGKISKKQKDYLNEIYTSNKRMVELVNSLLNVSRIELGTFSVEPVLSDLKEIVKDELNELKSIISKKKMKINVEFDDKLPKIYLDPKLIRIVYQNLLTNALKYTPDEGEINIKITTKDNDILSSISDNGYGIPQSQQSEIFKKLFRAENVKNKDTTGTGLGLYIVKYIVEKSSNGKLWFESIENKGTTFYFTLPKEGMITKNSNKKLT